MNTQTKLISITGPSGFNKSTLIKEILKRNPEFVNMIAYTDRPKRELEIEGENFKFITESEFTKMVNAEEFVEWQKLVSNSYRYGKTKKDFHDILEQNEGKIIFNMVNIINLPLVKRAFPQTKSIFVDIKNTDTLVKFLKNTAGITDDKEFEKRLKFATEERRRRHLADMTINMQDDIEESINVFMNALEKLILI